MSDDAGYNEFGFANQLTGYPTTNAFTPNLDALAAQSVVLRQGYVASALCSTSRAGLLLGQYQQRFGIEEALNANVNSPYGFTAENTIMPEHLKALGYTTGMIGKWHMGYVDGVNRPQDMGFDEFFGFLGGGRGYFQGEPSAAGVLRRGDTIVENSWANAQNGGYLTDVLGEEAVSFINNHADDGNPFYLHLAFTAPHTPLAGGPNGNGTTVLDYNVPEIAQIAEPLSRTLAALIHGMDRNIGKIMTALEAQGIDDNTIIVFLNDHGGPAYQIYSPSHGHNEPFRGSKGHNMEGGLRVPFFIKMPGVEPGVFGPPVTAYDLLPTFLAAAGGDPSQLDLDGTDLTPYLTGEETGRPHETLFWRGRNLWAIRRGDWKYTRPLESLFIWPNLYNLGVTEREHPDTDQIAVQPQIAAELNREFTFWEATLPKPLWGIFGTDDRNHFDHFVFRNDLGPVTTWGATNAWRQAGTTNAKTFLVDDAYANAILEFTTRNDANYTATNDVARMSGLTFMLNQLRFTGNFAGEADRIATINGGPLSVAINGRITISNSTTLLLTKSLTNDLPRLQLDATSSGTAHNFEFQVAHDLELMDDLEITGNGTQEFVFTGAIRDYFAPRNVTKNGSSRITLRGASTFRGNLTINGGEVLVSGVNAALSGQESITIGSQGKLQLDQGTIAVHTIDNADGGQLKMNGGRLVVDDVLGDLVNSGGTYAPGASLALSSISGNFTQTSGTLEVELWGDSPSADFDMLAVGGVASLGGSLKVKLVDGFVPDFGDRFTFLTAGAVQGSFNSFVLPSLPDGETWGLKSNGQSVTLIVGLPGDYNNNGAVDAADYTVWRNTHGQSTTAGAGADGDRDSQVGESDFFIWKSYYGAVRISSSNAAGGEQSVPEPTALTLFALAALFVAWIRPRPSTLRFRPVDSFLSRICSART